MQFPLHQAAQDTVVLPGPGLRKEGVLEGSSWAGALEREPQAWAPDLGPGRGHPTTGGGLFRGDSGLSPLIPWWFSSFSFHSAPQGASFPSHLAPLAASSPIPSQSSGGLVEGPSLTPSPPPLVHKGCGTPQVPSLGLSSSPSPT